MKTETRLCQHCGAPFTARVISTDPKRGRYCGRACGYAAQVQYPREPRACDGCGTTFRPNRLQARDLAIGRQTRAYCSPTCLGAVLSTQRLGADNPHWKGGVVQSRGYRYVRQPGNRVSHYVAQHRAVAAGVLGRPLLDSEIVHHIDGDEANNDPANLQVLTRSVHRRHHAALSPMAGEDHPNARLNWEAVRAIRARRGDSQRLLALDFGVCQQTISHVLRGKTWKEKG